MKRLIVTVDCDDVLVETTAPLINAYNKKYGTSVTVEDDAYNNDSPWQSDSVDTAIARVDTILRDDGLLKTVLPIDGAIDAIYRMAQNHELHLVTGRQSYMEAETRELINRYFNQCFSSIELTNYIAAASSDVERRSKGDICGLLGADVLIDDHIAHIESVIEAGIKEVIVFGDYPWNRRQTLPKGSVHCVDWSAVEKEIERIAST